MNLSQAKIECKKWLEYLERQDAITKALQLLASDRRAGLCDAQEGERRRVEIQGNGLTVYDGANLSVAVMVLLRQVDQK
jgi:hypothetical protein